MSKNILAYKQGHGITNEAAAEADTAAATAGSIAAAIPAAEPNVDEDGITAGAFIDRATRIALVTNVTELRTWAIEVDLDYEALLVDVAALRVTVNSLLAKLRLNGTIDS